MSDKHVMEQMKNDMADLILQEVARIEAEPLVLCITPYYAVVWRSDFEGTISSASAREAVDNMWVMERINTKLMTKH